MMIAGMYLLLNRTCRLKGRLSEYWSVGTVKSTQYAEVERVRLKDALLRKHFTFNCLDDKNEYTPVIPFSPRRNSSAWTAFSNLRLSVATEPKITARGLCAPYRFVLWHSGPLRNTERPNPYRSTPSPKKNEC